MAKSGLEFIILKFSEPLWIYLLTCQAYSAFMGRCFQGVHFIYQLLLFPFHLFFLTLFLLLCFIVGEEVADYDTLQ